MALEAAVFQQDLFSHINGTKDFYPLLLEPWFDDNNNNNISTNNIISANNNDTFLPYDFNSTTSTNSCYLLENNNNQVDFDWQSYYYSHGLVNDDGVVIPPSSVVSDLPLNNYDHECWKMVNSSSSPDEEPRGVEGYDHDGVPMPEMVMRPKQRRRARAKKNQEEIENQRMTHIAVERNRRKQMNEYLNVLRSLMPESYVQRGDQASIVGAAINFVKELEYNVHNLSAKKQMKENGSSSSSSSSSMPFGEFFTFPQFSSNNNDEDDQTKGSPQQLDHASVRGSGGGNGGGLAADVEVTMVESHAHLKIRLRRPPKQLSKLVSGLHSLRLSILHLNVNTADDGVVLYSFSLKVEDESKLNSVDDIAREVYQLLGRIQE